MRKPGRLSLWVSVPRSCFTNASRIRKPKPLRAGTLPTPRSATINRRSVRFSIKVISIGPAAPAYAYLFALIRSSVSRRPRLIARSVGNRIGRQIQRKVLRPILPHERECVGAKFLDVARGIHHLDLVAPIQAAVDKPDRGNAPAGFFQPFAE